MPKLKTRTGAQKRFRLTKTGKLMRRGQGNRHIKLAKSKTQTRRAIEPKYIYKAFAKKLRDFV